MTRDQEENLLTHTSTVLARRLVTLPFGDGTDGASQADPSAAGADGEGAAGGGGTDDQAPADTFAEERTKLEERARALQSERDRERAARERLAAELEQAKAGAAGGTPADTASDSTDVVLTRIDSLEAQLRAVTNRSVVDAARTSDEHKVLAALRPDLFDPAKYQSPEEFQATLVKTAEELKPALDAYAAAAVEAAKAAESEDGSGLTPSPSGTEGASPTGAVVTAETVKSMSFEELRNLPREDRDKAILGG